MALPLPRRVPHGGRDDRDLPGLLHEPGQGCCGLAAVLACAAGVAPALGAEGCVREVSIPGVNRTAPVPDQALVGDTVLGATATLPTTDTVTSDGVGFDSGYLAPGSTFSFVFSKAGRFRVPLHHPQVHEGRRRGRPDRPPGAAAARRRRRAGGPSWPGAGRCEAVLVEEFGGGLDRRSPRDARRGRQLHRPRADRATDRVPRRREGPGSRGSSSASPRGSTPVSAGEPERARAPSRAGVRAVLRSTVRERFAWRTVSRGRLDGSSTRVLAVPSGRIGRYRIVVRGAATAGPAIRGIRRSRPLTPAHPRPEQDARRGIRIGIIGQETECPECPRSLTQEVEPVHTLFRCSSHGSRIDSNGRPGGAWPYRPPSTSRATVLPHGHSVTIGGRISNHRAGVHVVLLAQSYHTRATRAATLTTRVGGHPSVPAADPDPHHRARVGANLGQPVRVGVAPVVSLKELREWVRLAVRVTAGGAAQAPTAPAAGAPPAPDGTRMAHGQPARKPACIRPR